MKKTIIALLIAFIIPSVVFASGFVSGSIGLSVVDDRPINEKIEKVDVSNIKFGPEVKVDLLFVEFDSAAYVAFDTEDTLNLKFSGTETLGVTFDILNVVKVGLGAGLGYNYDMATKAFGLDGAGVIGVDCASLSDALADASILGKLSVDAKLGSFTVGASALWNPGISLRGLKDTGISFTNIKLGVSAGYSF